MVKKYPSSQVSNLGKQGGDYSYFGHLVGGVGYNRMGELNFMTYNGSNFASVN